MIVGKKLKMSECGRKRVRDDLKIQERKECHVVRKCLG